MTPHLVRWHERYADQGLTIIEVNNGGIDTLNAVKHHAKELGITFPILYDTDESVTDAYDVTGFPTAVLIGRDGNVIWDGHPSMDVDAAHQRIKDALAN